MEKEKRNKAQAAANVSWRPLPECTAAIGLEHASPDLRKILLPPTGVNDSAFTMLSRPIDKGAWLLAHPEPGQTFADLALQRRAKVKAKMLTLPRGGCRVQTPTTATGHPRNIKTMVPSDRRTIYLVAVGDFPADSAPLLVLLRQYASIYFNMAVEILPRIDLDDTTDSESCENEHTHERECGLEHDEHDRAHYSITSRLNRGIKQLLTDDIVTVLERLLPRDAFCLLGVTMIDLYPQTSWNYVLGIAHPKRRVGVFSFARYSPSFGAATTAAATATTTATTTATAALTAQDQSLLLRSSMRVMVHELFHLFGVEHCQYYECVMQGANSVEEEEAHPLELCPVCLHKLHHTLQLVAPSVDLSARYAGILAFYKNLPEMLRSAFAKDILWVQARINNLS